MKKAVFPNKFLTYFISLSLLIFFVLPLYAASDNKGTDFLFSFLPNVDNKGNLSLFITSEFDTEGTVQIPGLNFTQTFAVQANSITTISLPAAAQNLPGNFISNLGVSIQADKEITVYGLNQRTASTDAFMALPSDVQGLEYMALSYNALWSYPSQVAVTGIFDNTEVVITPSATADGHAANQPFSVTLDKGESFLVEGGGWTGFNRYISCCKGSCSGTKRS